MIVISDCLVGKADEGTIKIASNMARLIKKRDASSTVISINKSVDFADYNIKLKKHWFSLSFIKLIRKQQGDILFIPNASMTRGICYKVFLLSLFTGKKIYFLPVYRRNIDCIMNMLLRISKVEIIVLSQESHNFYKTRLNKKVNYLTTGVDTELFNIQDKEIRRNNLRNKYGYTDEDLVVLHIGHMVEARNIRTLLEFPSDIKVVLIISTSTRWDEQLYYELKQKANILILHEYISNIQDYYHMADVYYFPVKAIGCIDIPLSVLEAAASGTNIVTTHFGELNYIKESNSFRFADDTKNAISIIRQLKMNNGEANREIALKYDWKEAIVSIFNIIEGEK